MKRETAIKYAREIARRVHSVNGLLATPGCRREAVRIRRIWVFGSTVKGKPNPNDLDVLIDIEEVGRLRVIGRHRGRNHVYEGMLRDARIDKSRARKYGWFTSKDSIPEALKWLTKGMKMVSRHTLEGEGAAPFAEQVLIYPRWDMDALADTIEQLSKGRR